MESNGWDNNQAATRSVPINAPIAADCNALLRTLTGL